MKKLLFISFCLLASFQLKATHIAGADITYEHISGNDYLIKVQLYRDCSGVGLPAGVNIAGESLNCSLTFNSSLTQDTAFEVTGLCKNLITTCNNGFYPGMEVGYYSGTVTLPNTCDDWVVSYGTCCRNTTNNLINQPASYFEVTIDNLNYPNNSSPFFVENPHPYACVNEPYCVNNSALDPDGDSLVYSFTEPLEAKSTPATFQIPHTYLEPIPGATIDSTTGNVCFTATQTGHWVFAIKIEEYDSLGNLKAVTKRDIQVTVIPCNTTTIDVAGTVTDSLGTAVASGDVEVYQYAGNEQIMTLVGNTTVNGSGQYSFTGLPGGKQYMIKAVPDTTNYPDHHPTYHDSSYFWAFANVINALCDTNFTADVKLGGYAALNYFYYISGSFSNTNKQAAPVSDASVFLINENNGRVVAHTTTDSNGDYIMEGLPAGSYSIVVDYPACLMESTYYFNLNNDTNNIAGLNFWTDSSFVYTDPGNVEVNVGISESISEQNAINVFPNPYSGATNIVVNVGESSEATLYVYNALGAVVQKLHEGELSGVNTFKFSAQQINQPQGIYYVRLVKNNQTWVKRLVEIR